MKQSKLLAALLCAVPSLAQAAADTLDEVVVTASRTEQSLTQTLSHTTVITRQDIEASQAADVPTLLRGLAGVEVYQSGGIGKQSSLFLRGTNSSHTLVLLDGVRINSATTGTTQIDQLMLDQIERIEVVRGNVSSLYGSEAIGGVIQIFTRRGKGQPSFNGSVGAGTQNTQRISAGFGGEAASTAFNLQVSKFKTDGVSAIRSDIVPTVNPDKDGYDNNSVSANVRHLFSNEHSLSGSLFDSNGTNQYDNAFATTTDANSNKSHIQKVSLQSDNRFGEAWLSKLQLSQGQDDYKDYLNGAQSSFVKTSNRQIGWQNTLALDASDSLLLGLERLDQQVDSTTAYTQTTRKVNSVFAGYAGSIGLHQLQVNLRQDRYSDFGATNTWLVGVGHPLGQSWRVTVNAGTAFKAPTFNDMYAPASWGGNPNLRPEKSKNAELSTHYANGGQRVDVTYFANQVHDLITYQFPQTVNIDEARINGVELAYKGQFGDTGVKLAATQQNPRDAKTGQTLLRRAKSFASAGVSQQFGTLRVGAEWLHSGERADIDINTFARTTLAAYDVVNLTAAYPLDKHLELSARVDNLFNKDYMLAHGYNTLGRTVFVGLSYR